MIYDLFISHASEDKDAFVRPLANALRDRGLEIWYDEFTLRLGDSLSQSIDNGLAQSRFGLIVLSPSFFSKGWPQRELQGLVAKEMATGKAILPVLHNLSREALVRHSPTLADKVNVSSSFGVAAVADKIYAEISTGRQNAFQLGRLGATMHLVDFTHTSYPQGAIQSRRVPTLDDAPPAYTLAYTRHLEAFKEKLNRREIFEGTPKIAPVRIVLDRKSGDESKAIYIEYSVSKGYVHQRAATATFQELSQADRALICQDPVATMVPFFSNSLGVSIGVISSDGKLTFVQRGGATAVNSKKIVCGVVEGMTVDDLSDQAIDPHLAARRALREELSIELAQADGEAISISGLAFNDDFHEWNFIGLADLRSLAPRFSSAEINASKHLALAHDAWEVNGLEFVDLSIESVAAYVLANANRLTNYAKVTAVLALLCAGFKSQDVTAAFASQREAR
jgi:hypothetical protein